MDLLQQENKIISDRDETESADIIRTTRQGLNGQRRFLDSPNVESCIARFGSLRTANELSKAISKTLPLHWAAVVWSFIPIAGWAIACNEFVRSAQWTLIERYARLIPDDAILKYSEAKKSGYFDSFQIIEPEYGTHQFLTLDDPWLVGRVKGLDAGIDDRYWGGVKQWIVIATWL